MIIDNEICIKASTRNISYLRTKKVDIKLGDFIKVSPIDYPFKKGNFYINVRCDICGNTKSIKWENYLINTNDMIDIYCCSEKCSIIKRNNHNIDKYGVKNIFELDLIKKKIIETNKKKYGGHPVKNDLIKDKIKKSMIEIYGVDSAIKNKEIKERIRNTCMMKYGVENPFELVDREKILKNRLSDSLNQIKEKYSYIVKITGYDNKGYICDCNFCGNSFVINNNILRERILNKKVICTICFPIYSSYPEKEISFLLNESNIQYEIKNRKVLNNLELDYFIDDKKLAIELNGVYWHSTNWKDKNYHYDKFKRCSEIGIDLFQIWEDDWKNKNEIVRSMILNKLGKTPNKIFARKCVIKEVKDFKLVKNFINNNHIQGWCVSKINIGLFYKDELVSIMTFGKKRLSLGNKNGNDSDYELIRFCNKIGYNIVGGASKLFKYFISSYKFDNIISYSNNDYSSGKLYIKLGFEFEKFTKPGYFYVKNFDRKNRFSMRKQNLTKMGHDPNLTENEILKKLKYLKIYNSGNKLFLYKNKIQS